MEVKVLNRNNIVSLSANYELDKQINFKSDSRASYHGIDLTLNDCLSGANDTSTNKYSNFYLSNGNTYKTVITIDRLSLPENRTVSTYIAINSMGGLTSESRYLSISSTELNREANVTFTTTLSNNNYFDIEFSQNDKCKISNTSGKIKRYLSFDYIDSKFKFLSSNSDTVNIFSYFFNTEANLFTLYKKIYEKVNFVFYDETTNALGRRNALSGAAISPVDDSNVFLIRQDNSTTLQDNLSTSNYVYKQSFDQSKLIVDPTKSVFDFNTNYLYNNEFYSIKPYKESNLNLNLLNLKNQKTVDNEQSQGGVFLTEPSFKHRYYDTLFTGVNQERGNYNIGLGFSSYTLTKVLKQDNLNYFHYPFDIYPYTKLNVNDSSLVISGAITSDTPYYADKIFKRLGGYKYSSPFGGVSDTQTGAYLCTWLSGGDDINASGLWVDRYYNPANVSYYDALSNISVPLITTNYDTISAAVDLNPVNYDLYDKKSDLTFEKGALYSYHHVGNENCKSYVNDLSGSIIFNNFERYFDKFYIKQDFTEEIYFDGNYFAKALDKSLDEYSTFDNFSVTYNMYNDDWNTPFGSQIVGNYTNRGFGIYNYRRITPHSITFQDTDIFIFNTFGKLLRTLDNGSSIINISKFEPNGDFLVFDNQAYVTKYNYIGTTLDKKKLDIIDNANLERSAFYTENKYVYILNGTDYYRLDSTSLKYKTSVELSTSHFLCAFGDAYTSIAVKNIKDRTGFSGKQTWVGLLSGIKPQIVDDNVYYYNNQRTLQYYNIDNQSITDKILVKTLNDYTFDTEGNFYVLYDDSEIAVIDQYDTVIQSQSVKLSTLTQNEITYGKNIEIINEWYGGNLLTNYLSIFSLSSNSQDVNIPCYTRTNTLFTDVSSRIMPVVYTSPEVFNIDNRINNYDYLRNNYDSGQTISAVLRLPNIYDVQTYEIATLTYPLSNISPGYHNFTATLDTTRGLFNLVIDGSNVDSYSFEDAKYSYGTIFDNAFFIGTEPSYGNNKLNENLNDVNYYNYGNFKIKDFYIYNVPLYLYDIANIVRSYYTIEDINFQLPCGKRNYVENIDKLFKFKLPGRKSNLFNIKILDTGITETNIQSDINNNIIEQIKTVIPANTRLNKIDWEVEND